MRRSGDGWTGTKDWELVNAKMRVVELSIPLQLLVPALIFPSLSRNTRGLTFQSGRVGLGLGALMIVASGVIGFLLLGPIGPLGVLLSAWLIGTAGVATLVGALRPTAYVKPICIRCRLLAIIREHEAIHLSGVASEKAVWTSMRTRHSVSSLELEGDPTICSFCPIPKRLAEH